MRAATWNLERGGRTRAAAPAQRVRLDEVGGDLVALTEPPATFTDGPGVGCSPPLRNAAPGENESWVAVIGPGVERVPLDIPYERTAVAARSIVGADAFVIYCAVLPWLAVTNHAK